MVLLSQLKKISKKVLGIEDLRREYWGGEDFSKLHLMAKLTKHRLRRFYCRKTGFSKKTVKKIFFWLFLKIPFCCSRNDASDALLILPSDAIWKSLPRPHYSLLKSSIPITFLLIFF